MPMMKKCRCGKNIDYYSKYCDKCSAEVEKEKQLTVQSYDKNIRNSYENRRYKVFYNSKPWKVLSDLVKKNYFGLCVKCYVDHNLIVPSDTTHHIEELRERWDLRLIIDNLIPLCHDCHNKIHANYTEKIKECLRSLLVKFKSTPGGG